MSQVKQGLDHGLVWELGLRFGWLKPIPMGVKTPKGDVWKLYSKDWTRRTVVTRNGKMETQEFLGLWKNCRNSGERFTAFGGVLPEVEEEMREWGEAFCFITDYKEFWGRAWSLDTYREKYVWDFDIKQGAWVFQVVGGGNHHADYWVRHTMDIHRWTARTKDEVKEVQEYLRKRLGID